MLLIFSLFPAPLVALSSKQKKVIDSGVYYFNTEASASNNLCSGSTKLVGSENAEKIWNYLVSNMGFTPIQAAGIMGNIQQESGFSPTALNPDSGAYGIVQWYAGRRTALENYASSKGVDKSDLGLQLEFLSKELNSDYKTSVLDPIKASSSLEEVTRIWLERFEVPCLPGSSGCAEEMKRRVPFAVVILTKYGSSLGGDSSSSDSTACGENSAGEVVGEFSLPVSKKWYLSNKEWFTKDHHDYAASDIPVPDGTAVYSMTAGKIISAPNEGGYGRGVTIDAGNGVQFIYGHGNDGGAIPGAKQGDTVRAGQLIMHSGNTGQSFGPHLHLEIRINGTKHCPQQLFVGIAEGNIPQLSALPTSGCWYKT